ncbi:hypothetical protein ACFP8Z_01285 [Gemmobacter lanyuensis]|uniref:hypothetical protein n=1 Tax=Gemmobacter lanyuensis TaxID=1054497 RepID=UPI00360FE5DB
METVVPFDLQRMVLGDQPPLFLAEILFRIAVIWPWTMLLLRWIGGAQHLAAVAGRIFAGHRAGIGGGGQPVLSGRSSCACDAGDFRDHCHRQAG